MPPKNTTTPKINKVAVPCFRLDSFRSPYMLQGEALEPPPHMIHPTVAIISNLPQPPLGAEPRHIAFATLEQGAVSPPIPDAARPKMHTRRSRHNGSHGPKNMATVLKAL